MQQNTLRKENPVLQTPVTVENSLTIGNALMWKDLMLPDDIQPHPGKPHATIKSILLTGATGFLGSHLLHTLAKATTAKIYCLVRPRKNQSPLERIEASLKDYGLYVEQLMKRVIPVAGDIRRENLGLSPFLYERLSTEVDRIYHTAATVNWVFPYRGLRESNVQATKRLLHLACRNKTKNFYFISSIGVCYTASGPNHITENENMIPYLNEIPLAYAQTKCVSEALVRQAGERGLPVSIFRPGLISGNTQSGKSNTDDIFSRILKACIEMGSAPDLDWTLDYCPVDFVADTVVQCSLDKNSQNKTFHLINRECSHWGELILWLNCNGYPVRLVSYSEWEAQLKKSMKSSEHILYPLRSFFFEKPELLKGMTLPEFYQKKNLEKVSSNNTEQTLNTLGLTCPPLNTVLMNSYLATFVENDFIQKQGQHEMESQINISETSNNEIFQKYLRHHFRDGSLRIQSIDSPKEEPRYSILSELVSMKTGKSVGLQKYHLKLKSIFKQTPGQLNLFVKSKAEDKVVLATAQKIASVCGEPMGDLFAKYHDRLGFTQTHQRELHIYQQDDPRFRKHTPTIYGILNDDKTKSWKLLMEDLQGLAMMNSVENNTVWLPLHLQAVVQGLAQLHSIWWRREEELKRQPWLEAPLTSMERIQMNDLWKGLAHHAHPFFKTWGGESLTATHKHLIKTLPQWSGFLNQSPQTLIHNDFNPRNLALRITPEGFKLCAYDWELAGLGIPQHDLAEFLCYVLPPDCQKKEVLKWIHLHQECLETLTGESINFSTWLKGFQVSLFDLLIHRFSVYTLVHRFHPQPYLPRILNTWQRLHDLLLN